MEKVEIGKRRWLFLPVETIARELTAKTLLACAIAERGWGVIVGEKKVVRGKQEKLPRGTFIEKSISPGRIADIEKAHAAGNRVSAWCEEGLVYINRDEYGQRRLEPQSFQAIDYFFAWGRQQAEDITAILGPSDKIILSGNPRFDLLRPELRNIFAPSAQKIKEKFGKIILINTKFSDVNNNRDIPDFDFVSYLCSAGKIRTKEVESLMRRYIGFNRKIFQLFQELVPVLSRKYSEHTIIVRPHPSESHAPWLELSRDLPNVQVIFEGNVNEWLMAADIMIHNNCTTGIEAFLLDRPSISYRPLQDPVVEHELPNEVSLQAFSLEELLALVSRFAEEGDSILPEEREKQKRYAQQYIANIDGNLACDTIGDYLDRLDLPEAAAVYPLDKENAVTFKDLKRKMKRLLGISRKSDTSRYYKQKFPGITLEEMQSLKDKLSEASGRFADIRIAPVEDNTFCFYRP